MNINKLKELTIENIVLWPFQLKLGLIGILFLAISWLGYNWVLAKDFRKLSVAISSVKELKNKAQLKQQQVNSLDLYKKQLQSTQNDFVSLLESAHAIQSDDNLMDEITKMGSANGVQFKSIKSFNEQQIDDWGLQVIQIVLTGNYQQLMQFLNQINSLKQLLVVSDFNFEKEDSEQLVENLNNEQLTLSMTMQDYHYLGDVEVHPFTNNAKLNKAILITRNIFSPKLSLNNAQLNETLLGFPISALHLVGTILQDNKNVALISTPIGKVYWVTIGNRMGQHNGKVTAITKNYIDVTEMKNQEESEEQVRLMLGR